MLGIPLTAKFDHSSIESMVFRSSYMYPELPACVSYTLHKLQMIDITLKVEQSSAMEPIILQPSRCGCVATYWLWKEFVLSSPAIHHGL